MGGNDISHERMKTWNQKFTLPHWPISIGYVELSSKPVPGRWVPDEGKTKRKMKKEKEGKKTAVRIVMNSQREKK